MTNSKKINLGAFSDAELLKVLAHYKPIFNADLENNKFYSKTHKNLFSSYVKNLVEKNFIDNGDFDFNVKNFSLFILGNKNNLFDLFLNKINNNKI
jgi:hypothetical protein